MNNPSHLAKSIMRGEHHYTPRTLTKEDEERIAASKKHEEARLNSIKANKNKPVTPPISDDEIKKSYFTFNPGAKPEHHTLLARDQRERHDRRILFEEAAITGSEIELHF